MIWKLKAIDLKKDTHSSHLPQFGSITTMVELFSHNILQKSSVVSANGPCVAI